MELRNNGGTTHFMHTIRNGRVIVVCNTNSLGKPVIKSKILKDVYENEDANGPQRLSSGMLFDHEHVKHENPCFPQADRTLWGTKCKSDGEFSPTDHNSDSGLDDDTTLKQLKKRLFTKKRKCIPKQEGKKAVEDESDLHEPLINLKQKRSKTSKSKRRRMNTSAVSSSTVDFVTKIDEKLISEGSSQICDKVDERLYPGRTSTNEIKNTVLCGYREPMLCAQEYQNCSNNPNTILYDHVGDSEPISMLVGDGTCVALEPLEMECQELIDFPPSSIQMENEIRDAHNSSSVTVENISSPDIQVSDMDLDCIDGGSGLPKDFSSVLLQDKSEVDFHTDVEDSPSSPEKHCGSYTDSIILSKIEENVVSTVYTIANDMEFSSVPLEDKSEADFPYELEDSPTCPDKNCGSYQDSIIFPKIKENVVSTLDMELSSFPLENKTDADFPNELENSLTIPDKIFDSCQNSIISSKIEENLVSTEDTIASDMEFRSVPLEDLTAADFTNELEDSLSNTDKNLGSCPSSIISSKIEENVVSTEDTIASGMEFRSVPLEDKTEADFTNELKDSLSSPDKNLGSYPNSIISSKIEKNVVSTEDTIASGIEFRSIPLEDKTEADFTSELEDSLSSSDKNLGSYPDSIISLKIDSNVVSIEDTIADEDQSSTCSNVRTRNGLNCEGHSEAELLKAKEKQTKARPLTDGESQPSLENQTHDVADAISTLEPYLSPENLLSTRKAISPSSQEQLCLEMNSVETWNDADQNHCEEKLFEKQTTKKASSLRSEMQHDKVTGNHKCPDKVRQRKVIISPRHNHSIKKKLRIPKGNLEPPRFSRALPNLSTDCTSIQSCSERAIEFSKQQMHDMESLALKLMNELKSMKDIVEQKLLFEAYRNVSLKNDADEVKSAIDSASKVEETSRKWLSIMSRDCNRFCKIMKMTPNTPAASSDTTPPRERRKIVFADEAGGDLCHVKFFQDDDTISSPTNQA